MWGSTVNPNPPHCPRLAPEGFREAKWKEFALAGWCSAMGQMSLWPTISQSPSSCSAPSIWGQPWVSSSAWTSRAWAEDLPGSFSAQHHSQTPTPLTSALWRHTLNFLGQSTPARHQPCSLRDYTTPIFPPHPTSSATGEGKGAFQRNPERSLALTDLLLGREEQGDTSKIFVPQKAAGMLLPLDVTATPRAAEPPSRASPRPQAQLLTTSACAWGRESLSPSYPWRGASQESVQNRSVLVRRAIAAPSSAPAPAAGWPARVLARYTTADRGQMWHLP